MTDIGCELDRFSPQNKPRRPFHHLSLLSILMATLASCGSTVQNPTPWVEASDYQNFADCITSEETEGRTILVDAAMYIETDITVPRNRDLFFVNGGMLSIAEGKVLRIEGTVTAALFQIFSGNGAVRFGGGNVANLYPQWWGATGDGLHDDTAAIQNAIDARYSTDVDQQGFTTVAFPSGAYYCSSTILVSKDRTHLVGNGNFSTRIYFAPSAEDVLFEFAKPIPEPGNFTSLYSCSISDMAIIGIGEYSKTAIRLVNTSDTRIENISISSWTGSGSIGILMHGRELTFIDGATIFADRPIQIDKNLSNGPEGFIDSDHLHMEDLYLGATPSLSDGKCIEIMPGVDLTNFVLDGTNSFVMAKYGLYWDDTETVGSSNNMSISNVRMEQSTSAYGYVFYLSHNYVMQNIYLENVFTDMNGFYFRKCNHVTLQNCVVATAPPADGYFSVNADDSCRNIEVRNSLFVDGLTQVPEPLP